MYRFLEKEMGCIIMENGLKPVNDLTIFDH